MPRTVDNYNVALNQDSIHAAGLYQSGIVSVHTVESSQGMVRLLLSAGIK